MKNFLRFWFRWLAYTFFYIKFNKTFDENDLVDLRWRAFLVTGTIPETKYCEISDGRFVTFKSGSVQWWTCKSSHSDKYYVQWLDVSIFYPDSPNREYTQRVIEMLDSIGFGPGPYSFDDAVTYCARAVKLVTWSDWLHYQKVTTVG